MVDRSSRRIVDVIQPLMFLRFLVLLIFVKFWKRKSKNSRNSTQLSQLFTRYMHRRENLDFASRLLDILDVDLDWHMHAISDGERRRVQLCMGLMSDWDVLLLDEVTVDLDVLVRDDLLQFLKNDSETRGATILYATHIFDGLNEFPTHIAHMHLGTFLTEAIPWPVTGEAAAQVSAADLGPNPTLYRVALEWLREDRERRRLLENQGRKKRGARKDDVPSDSETFYRKYDYSH